MSGTRREVPRMTPKRKMFLVLLHNVQLLFAVVILSLDAYSIRYMVYKSLAYSFVVALCTMCGCAYMLISLTIKSRLFIKTVAVVWSVILWIFWIVNTGCIGRLAWMWRTKSPCSVEGVDYGYKCDSADQMQDLQILRRDFMSSKTFAGILVTSAIFSGLQIILFSLTSVGYVSADSGTDTQQELPSDNVSMRGVAHGHPSRTNVNALDSQTVPPIRTSPQLVIPRPDNGSFDDSGELDVTWRTDRDPVARFIIANADGQDRDSTMTQPSFSAEDTGLNLRAGETRHDLYSNP